MNLKTPCGELFDSPWLQVRDMLTEDGESHRFNKSGTALDISHVQMARYLDAIKNVIQQIVTAEQVLSQEWQCYAREQQSMIKRMESYPGINITDRKMVPLLGHEVQVSVLLRDAPMTVGDKNPQQREMEAFGIVCGTYLGTEHHFDGFEAPASGRYRLKFRGWTYWAGAQEGNNWWRPDRLQASRGRTHEPVTIYGGRGRELRKLGSFDLRPEPETYELDVFLGAGEKIQTDAARLIKSRPGWNGNPLATREGMPGIAWNRMEVEGPLDPHPLNGYRSLFGELPCRMTDGGFFEISSSEPRKDAERLLITLMKRAWRRPLRDGEHQRFLRVIYEALDAGSSFAEAMSAGYTAALCSPGFIYLEEEPGTLDSHALASRLAFFLWNSPPDAELRRLADASEIRRPEILEQQTQRLLDDDRARRFTDAFLDYWIDLRNINATTPDSTLYSDYYLDDLLVESAVAETQLFFAELVKSDLPARNIVSSDFSILNERLAAHYAVPAVKGVKMRRVQLPSDSPRGGLLTQCSVLKITANGTTTSPVLRGAWITERILGQPVPPPPPNVPAVEPDTRGATTIREQLAKHRSVESCAVCHNKMDPAGFALESFDVLGGFRERYRALDESKEPVQGIGKNGHRFAFHYAQQVDASGELPDGRHFQDVRELKQLILQDERQIARNLVRQLIIFATGAPVRFGDRPEVEQILDQAAQKEYGVRSLIHGVVQSQIFQSK